ncbi:MAG: dTMP kinase [Sulfurimicrobium sp.]|nr:dTMP kinase [Sulfurimicrobium sp.]MDO9190887.1 dTMP kinase [Sulfurimicrobium sp.]MDP1705817.1 dTMP kinase [Sulfurimicrobium sp.]MDP2199549.1 dTMP kinase [Sulfurimicrobium sp.]MDP2963194.1 dTMP kinase [Sulfurimicrobium sp.]
MKGKFITLEGIDGAGKSTHLAWLAETLTERGQAVVVTREPGGTPLGETLRGLLLNHDMHLETEALLMFAARREHLAQVILPALEMGKWVISDRFTDASFAYQGGGRGIAESRLRILEDWVQQDLQPDLTLLFDVPLEVARQRLSASTTLDRFEQERQDFFQRVRQAYLSRAAQFPERIRVIDSTRTVPQIRAELETLIGGL